MQPQPDRKPPRRALGALPWLLPALAMLGLFYLYPIFEALRLAFTDARLFDAAPEFSLASIQGLAGSPALGPILRNTLVYTVASVVGQIALGLAIALLVVRAERARLRGTLALRTIVLAAWVIPAIANGIIWQLLLSEAPFGALNSALRMVGIGPVAWLSDPGNAMTSAVIATIWQGTAYSMILLYAALKTIDPTLYEAAAIDDAPTLSRFWCITLPHLRPAILVNAILILIMTLNMFDTILSLTGGGPGRATEVLSLYAYNTVFQGFELGRGAALAVLMLLISLALTALMLLLVPRGRR
jgi:multiple sugar transport system permease protein